MCLNTPLLHHLIVKNQPSFRLILFRSSLSLGASRSVATQTILIELFSSSIVFFILFFKDQLLSSASLRSLQATGISIPTFSEPQALFSKNFHFRFLLLIIKLNYVKFIIDIVGRVELLGTCVIIYRSGEYYE